LTEHYKNVTSGRLLSLFVDARYWWAYNEFAKKIRARPGREERLCLFANVRSLSFRFGAEES